MKALSVKQPWAHLICTPREDNPLLGIKDIENRTWRTNFRGKIYIHVSGKPLDRKTIYDVLDEKQWDFVFDEKPANNFDADNLYYSAIIGEVEIIDCVVNHDSIWAEQSDVIGWVNGTKKPTWNWVLANPVLYDKPIINVKGALSFWEPKPNQRCMVCGTDYFGHDAEYCCNGKECGCMGMPIEPLVCSKECYDKLISLKS